MCIDSHGGSFRVRFLYKSKSGIAGGILGIPIRSVCGMTEKVTVVATATPDRMKVIDQHLQSVAVDRIQRRFGRAINERSSAVFVDRVEPEVFTPISDISMHDIESPAIG